MKKKFSALIFFIIMSFCITGCAENKIPEMTSEQIASIGEFAAFTLMKYDAQNRSRLVELMEETPIETEDETEIFEDTSEENKGSMDPVAETPIVSNVENNVETYALDEVLKCNDFVRINYKGYEVCDKYPQDETNSYFGLSAKAGCRLLVISFDLSNISNQDYKLDILSGESEFYIYVNDDYYRRAMPTMLLNDLSTMNDTLKPGEERQAVLVIEIDNSIDEIERLNIKLKNESSIYTISM